MGFWTRGAQRIDAELNLIPLIDIMSVLVAFLLIYTAEVDLVQNAKGVEIPQSTAEAKPQQSVVIMITKDDLFVQGEPVTHVADILRGSAALVEPLRLILDRPMLANNAADQSSREITVIADKSLPFEVVKKVMATCTATAYGKISLAVIEKGKPAGAGGQSSTLSSTQSSTHSST
jgi:biopolymer transport protein ExbD